MIALVIPVVAVAIALLRRTLLGWNFLAILIVRGWDVALIHILIELDLADRLRMDVNSTATT